MLSDPQNGDYPFKDNTVTEAAQTIMDHKVGSVFMKDNGQYLGIITEGEIFQKVIEEIRKPIEVQASEIHVSTYYYHRG